MGRQSQLCASSALARGYSGEFPVVRKLVVGRNSWRRRRRDGEGAWRGVPGWFSCGSPRCVPRQLDVRASPATQQPQRTWARARPQQCERCVRTRNVGSTCQPAATVRRKTEASVSHTAWREQRLVEERAHGCNEAASRSSTPPGRACVRVCAGARVCGFRLCRERVRRQRRARPCSRHGAHSRTRCAACPVACCGALFRALGELPAWWCHVAWLRGQCRARYACTARVMTSGCSRPADADARLRTHGCKLRSRYCIADAQLVRARDRA